LEGVGSPPNTSPKHSPEGTIIVTTNTRNTARTRRPRAASTSEATASTAAAIDTAADAASEAGPAPRRPELLEVAPGELLIDVNVRVDPAVDADFLDSIRAHGILQPIIAVRTVEGPLRVRFGHRRTLGAIAVELPTAPVVVVGDEATDDGAQIERILTQWDENVERTGLGVADEVNAVAQLEAFGLPAEQIVTRLRRPRESVDAALKVAGSKVARAAAAKYDFLDLTQAAALAEFQDDHDAVVMLAAAASRGQFEHTLQRMRDDREKAQKLAAFETRLRERGITVVAEDHESARSLDDLCTPDRADLDPASHADCPGHAAYVITTSGYVDPETGEPVDDDEEDDEINARSRWTPYLAPEFVCLDPYANGHVERWATSTTGPGDGDQGDGDQGDGDQEESEEARAEREAKKEAAAEAAREAARAERRDVIDSNKAWTSAETVRRNWLGTFAARKTAPRGTASFLAAAIAADGHIVGSANGHDLACELLSVSKTGYGRSAALGVLITKAAEARAQVLALVQVLAAYEDNTTRDHWRYMTPATQRYLKFLQANGYPISPVELRACGETPDPAAEAAPEPTA
jgi:ParB family transcriptional regulator, chromosome partitioning protein